MEQYRWGEKGLWSDVRRLGAIALKFITTQPLASHGEHTKYLDLHETDDGLATQEYSLEEIKEAIGQPQLWKESDG